MNKNLKKGLLLMLVFILSISVLVGCGGKKEEGETPTADGNSGEKATVGVSMPTKSLQRWNQDGANMKAELEAKGYNVELEYAENKTESQVAQIENMITKGADVLVVAAIDGSALTNVLDTAKDEGVRVISYDRLILNTDAIDYYATFDNYNVGTIQGKYIEEKLGLDKGEEGPFNLEIATGPLDDNNVNFFFGGAMDVLNPYIEKGVLVVRSGQTTMEQTATPEWDEQEAQTRMDNILTAHYTSENIDAVLCSNDSVSLGVQSALKSAGYGDSGIAMPILTGQDANISNVKAIVAGDQSMSVFKDTRALATKVTEMVDALIKGEEVEVNDEETYDNGVKIVPSYLLEPKFVDADNYQELLIDSGYYSEDEVK